MRAPPWPTRRARTGHEPGHSGRHPGDVLRLALGLLLLAVAVLAVQRDRLTTFERNLFRLLNDLPSELAVVLGPLMELGNVAAAPVVGVALLLATRRHLRVALDVTVAGALAWWAAKAVKDVIERPRPVGFITGADRLVESGLGFVSGHTAVAAAIVTAANPYLPRRVRRAIWALPWIVGLARIFYGAHLPLDVVGGVALGWAVGAAIHLVAGAPHRVPTLQEAADAMRRTGGGPWTVDRVAADARGSFPFVADDGTRRVFVKLLDPEPRDRDWLYRMARFLAFRDVRDEAEIADNRSQADHEAALALLARSRGVRTPQVLAIEIDGQQVWIVQEHLDADSIDGIPRARLSDGVLEELWRQVGALRRVGIAHRDLVAGNILLDHELRPWLVDFAHARSTHAQHAFDNDVAELLVTTAGLVGPARAVAAADRVLGRRSLVPVLAELQPFALTAEGRRRLRRQAGLLDALREELGRAVALDVAPARAPRAGAKRRGVLLLGLAAAVIGLVTVAGWGATAGSVEADAWRWLGFAVLAAAVAVVARAVTLLAAIDRRLAVGRTALLLAAGASVAIAEGSRSARAMIAGHLQRAGVPPAEATGGLRRAGRAREVVLVVGGLVTVLALAASDPVVTGDVSLVGFVALALVAGAIEFGIGGGGERPWRVATSGPVRGGATTVALWSAAAVQVLATVGSTIAVTQATGGGPAIAGVAIVQLGAAALSSATPLAAGGGALTAAVAAGLVVLGMPPPGAVAAAVLAAAVQVWLPGLTGALATRRA